MDDSLVENYSNSENLYSDNINNTEKKMPQNLEAEQSLLGSILFDNKILEDIPTNFNNLSINILSKIILRHYNILKINSICVCSRG